MNDLHARAKEAFLEAIRLPVQQRAALLDQVCDGDQALRREVETLLDHHQPGTILEVSQEPPETVGGTVVVAQPPRAATGPAAFDGGELPLLAAETQTLLRHRLWAITLVLTVAEACAIGKHLFHPEMLGIGFRLTSFLLLVGCLAVLRLKRDLGLRSLRLLELAVLVNIGGLFLAVDVRLMIVEAAQQDVAMTVSANNWNYLSWSVLILIYGIFMPNTWRRAATVMLPAACVPYVVSFVVCSLDAAVATVLGEVRYGMPVPVPFLAALTGIYAAHIIHSVRLDAFRSRQFAQYRLKRLLGVGGMGEVYEAEHLLLKRPCAIKLIRPDQQLDASAIARFEREARATARLSHPHTVEVYDFGRTDDGAFYCVMELLPGLSLAELVQRFGPLPPSRTVHFLKQACGALREAHDAGLIHRDIKPANLFASERGGLQDVTKLLDFGLVRVTQTTDPQLTTRGTIAGTPDFMAPEQAISYHQADACSDLYALGGVAYFLLTGQAPFGDAPSLLAGVVAHASQPVRPPSQLRGGIPADLERVVLRCLEKAPADRFQSAAQLAEALDGCQVEAWTNDMARTWWQTHSGS